MKPHAPCSVDHRPVGRALPGRPATRRPYDRVNRPGLGGTSRGRTASLAVVLFLVGWMPETAQAQESPAGGTNDSAGAAGDSRDLLRGHWLGTMPEEPPLASELWNVGLWTVTGFVGVAGFLWAVKRCGLTSPGPGRAESGVTLTGTLTLAPRTGLFLIRAADSEVLVAVDARGIAAMTPLPRPFAAFEEAAEHPPVEAAPVVLGPQRAWSGEFPAFRPPAVSAGVTRSTTDVG